MSGELLVFVLAGFPLGFQLEQSFQYDKSDNYDKPSEQYYTATCWTVPRIIVFNLIHLYSLGIFQPNIFNNSYVL